MSARPGFLNAVLFLFLVCVFPFAKIEAQNVPATTTLPAATPATVPAAYSYTIANYVRTWVPSFMTTDTAAVTAGATNVQQVKQSTQYFDGLGRGIQSVSKAMSPQGYDMVSPVLYDAYGREQYKYLPYVQTGTSDGGFKSDAFISQQTFYQNTTLNPGAQGEQVFYEETQYEASPLNRVAKTFAPGNSWASTGGNHSTAALYQVNTVADSVRVWTLPTTGNIPTTAAMYGVGLLFKNIVTDEGGSISVEFKDREGRVILRKQSLTNTLDGHTGWLCTYYVYDNNDNIRFVIPPKAVTSLNINGWGIPQIMVDELCFQYTYDDRNRMITKKVPGAGFNYMVYDLQDRLAFSRDSNLTVKGQWLAVFYDAMNRQVMTALYPSTLTREQLQANMDGNAASSPTLTNTSPGVADLVISVRNAGQTLYQASQSVSFQPGFSSEDNAEFSAIINPAYINDTTQVTVNNPMSGITGYQPLTYTFYDDYSFTGSKLLQTADLVALTDSGNVYAMPVVTNSTATVGLVTGAKVRILGTDQWLTTTNFYDSRNRVIQINSDNIGGGQDVVSSLYNFNGNILSTYLHHTNQRSGNTPETRILSIMIYDGGGRLVKVLKKVNADAQQLIAQNTYDELGRLQKKVLGSNLEHLDYQYNIRGWETSLNKNYLSGNNSVPNHFAEQLNYDLGFSVPQYNGNIAGTQWKGSNAPSVRAYGYTYDAVNRLTGAEFRQSNGTTFAKDIVDYTVSNLKYDNNGNIASMDQRGLKAGKPAGVDQLIYQYQDSTNKLKIVRDGVSDPSSTLGDFKESAANNTGNLTGTVDYAYDGNGNLLSDQNKGIASITYNHLNLPELITITGKGTIQYLYDATGNKMRKIVSDNTVSPAKVTTADYIGNFLYQNDTMQQIAHEEGRIRLINKTGQPPKFVYDFFVKDHLGNTRLVLTPVSDTAIYAATMETASSTKENALFSNIDNTRTALPAGYPTDNTTNPNAYVSKLNAVSGQKIGPSLVLRVMAGDTVQIGAKAFYKSAGVETSASPLSQMLAALLQSFAGGALSDGTHAGTGSTSPIAVSMDTSLYNQLKQQDPNQNLAGKPKAYLNYVLFDDQFNMVSANSGVRQVQGNADELQTLATGTIVMKNTGFLYVYTSNESAQDVYFDNVVVNHTSGPLLEETHYYPFGLTMAGVSSHALKGMDYSKIRKKFQGQELDEELDLNWYEFKWRNQDPQIGRFNEIDPLSAKYVYNSPYTFSENHVTSHVELEGLEKWSIKNGIGENTTIYGPYANRNAAQQYFDDNFTTAGTELNSEDGFVQNSRISSNRIESLERGDLNSVAGIILHRTASSSTAGTLRAFEVGRDGVHYGTHFLVGTSGEILQTASLNNYTLHVGKVRDKSYPTNMNSIGIEVVGNYDGSNWDPLTSAQTNSVAFLTNSLKLRYGLTNTQVYNHETISYKTEGEGQTVRTAINRFLASPPKKKDDKKLWWTQYSK